MTNFSDKYTPLKFHVCARKF